MKVDAAVVFEPVVAVHQRIVRVAHEQYSTFQVVLKYPVRTRCPRKRERLEHAPKLHIVNHRIVNAVVIVAQQFHNCGIHNDAHAVQKRGARIHLHRAIVQAIRIVFAGDRVFGTHGDVFVFGSRSAVRAVKGS